VRQAELYELAEIHDYGELQASEGVAPDEPRWSSARDDAATPPNDDRGDYVSDDRIFAAEPVAVAIA
jgi:hypothetical protein